MPQSDRVQVFEPYRIGLPPLGGYLREIWQRRAFALEQASAALKSQHAGTFLGQLWLILNPLFLAVVYYVLILVLGRRGQASDGYFVYLMAGVFGFYFFSTALTTGATSVSAASGLVLRLRMPRLLLPLSTLVAALRRFIPAVVILALAALLSGTWPTTLMLQTIPAFILLVLFTIGAVNLAAVAQVYVRDVATIVPMIARIGLYLSPVLYFPDEVPEPLLVALQLNPLFWIMAAWAGGFGDVATMSPGTWLVASIWAVGMFVVGTLTFLLRERDLPAQL